MRSAFRLRATLLPYTYSKAREAYDEGNLTRIMKYKINDKVHAGLSLLRPMYYEYPESPEAYTFNKQVCLMSHFNGFALIYMYPLLFDSISLGQICWLLQSQLQWITRPT